MKFWLVGFFFFGGEGVVGGERLQKLFVVFQELVHYSFKIEKKQMISLFIYQFSVLFSKYWSELLMAIFNT